MGKSDGAGERGVYIMRGKGKEEMPKKERRTHM